MKKIKLTKGKYALVDDEDFVLVSKFTWHFDGHYAMHNTWDKKIKKRGTIRMHRLLMSSPKELEIDHINRNKLDNRRSNLRIVTLQINRQNLSEQRKNNTSGYRGIRFYKRGQKWESTITVNNKQVYLGRFLELKDAVIARKKAELQYYGI